MNFLSLFSGIEAASEAWEPLGWRCVGFSEIENFTSEVLRQRHPGVPNLGDVTKITELDIIMLGPIDLIVFGSPCQDLSVAGKQKGLSGARSGLFFAAMRIVGWCRKHCGLRFALWENVPGAFSSNAGRDFAAVVDALVGLEPGITIVPERKKWGTEGCALGPLGMVEWSTLDAQWRGVAQRRRRVFALSDFGDWAGRPPILLEPEGLRGDTAPRRETGQGVAGTLASCAGGGGFPSTDNALDGYLVPEGCKRGPDVACAARSEQLAGQLQRPVLGCAGIPAIAHCLNAGAMGRIDYESETFIPVAYDTTQITSKANGCNPQPGDPCHPLAAAAHPPLIAFDSRQDCVHSTEVFGSLGSSSPQAQAIAFQGAGTNLLTGDISGTLRSNGGSASGSAPMVAYSTKLHNTSSNQAGKVYEEYTVGLDANSPPPVLLTSMQVRRLTPRECERLQGFPDDHTLITTRGKPAADGPRYKALGNSMAVPVMRWIGQQIDFATLF